GVKVCPCYRYSPVTTPERAATGKRKWGDRRWRRRGGQIPPRSQVNHPVALPCPGAGTHRKILVFCSAAVSAWHLHRLINKKSSFQPVKKCLLI
ncbi:unnamed protein product, partial [Tetraodon nigroviridis]